MATVFTLIVLLFSLVIHEVAHGRVALSLGDTTARDQGRLSLNPLVHLDPVGSILVPAFLFFITAGQGPLFGWARPVPVNPSNFKDQKTGVLKVSLAGPLSNFLVAVVLAIVIRLSFLPVQTSTLLEVVVIYNLLWGFFNLVPLPPLDGSQILFSLLPESLASLRDFLYRYGQILLLFFIFFGFGWLDRIVFSAYRLLLG